MSHKSISVIIPVYNAEKYIIKAIDSALLQDEVFEIIVIDDGSTDNSLDICLEKSKTENKVKVFFHKKNINKGRSATRNLGITKASGVYIAFLDADDFYLPERFKKDVDILDNNTLIDGVYNAISAFFYRKSTKIEEEKLKLTTIRDIIDSKDLFEKMGPIGGCGYFSGIALTVRKDIFKKTGTFNEDLIVAEDTELWIKMSLKCNLVGGVIEKPVALRGVHDNNTSFNEQKLYAINNLKMYNSLYQWSVNNDVPFSKINHIWKKIWQNRVLNKTSFISDVFFWITHVFRAPQLLKLKMTYKTFPIFKKIKNIFK